MLPEKNKQPEASPEPQEPEIRTFLDACDYGTLEQVQAFYTADKLHRTNQVGSTPLILAAGTGHLDVIKFLLDKIVGTSADKDNARIEALNHRNIHQATSFMAAIFYGKTSAAKYLFQPADLSKLNMKKQTALFLATCSGNIETIKYVQQLYKSHPIEKQNLVTSVDPLDMEDVSGITPFMYALFHGMHEVAEHLFRPEDLTKLSTQEQQTPFHLAVCTEGVATIKFVQKMHALHPLPPNEEEVATDPLDARNLYAHNPFLLALFRGNLAAAQHLFRPEDLATTAKGSTPLHCAAASGDVQTINFVQDMLTLYPFLPQESSTTLEPLDMPDAKGNTPLVLGLVHGHLTACRVLFRAKDLSIIDEYGHTLLHIAAYSDNIEIIKFVLDMYDTYPSYAKDDPSTAIDPRDITNEQGRTPFMSALLEGKFKAAKYLFQPKDLTKTSNIENTALHIASVSENPTLILFVIDKLTENHRLENWPSIIKRALLVINTGNGTPLGLAVWNSRKKGARTLLTLMLAYCQDSVLQQLCLFRNNNIALDYQSLEKIDAYGLRLSDYWQFTDELEIPEDIEELLRAARPDITPEAHAAAREAGMLRFLEDATPNELKHFLMVVPLALIQQHYPVIMALFGNKQHLNTLGLFPVKFFTLLTALNHPDLNSIMHDVYQFLMPAVSKEETSIIPTAMPEWVLNCRPLGHMDEDVSTAEEALQISALTLTAAANKYLSTLEYLSFACRIGYPQRLDYLLKTIDKNNPEELQLAIQALDTVLSDLYGAIIRAKIHDKRPQKLAKCIHHLTNLASLTALYPPEAPKEDDVNAIQAHAKQLKPILIFSALEFPDHIVDDDFTHSAFHLFMLICEEPNEVLQLSYWTKPLTEHTLETGLNKPDRLGLSARDYAVLLNKTTHLDAVYNLLNNSDNDTNKTKKEKDEQIITQHAQKIDAAKRLVAGYRKLPKDLQRKFDLALPELKKIRRDFVAKNKQQPHPDEILNRTAVSITHSIANGVEPEQSTSEESSKASTSKNRHVL